MTREKLWEGPCQLTAWRESARLEVQAEFVEERGDSKKNARRVAHFRERNAEQGLSQLNIPKIPDEIREEVKAWVKLQVRLKLMGRKPVSLDPVFEKLSRDHSLDGILTIPHCVFLKSDEQMEHVLALIEYCSKVCATHPTLTVGEIRAAFDKTINQKYLRSWQKSLVSYVESSLCFISKNFSK